MDARPLSFCLISREYPPFFGGGIGTYTVQCSRALAAAGHRVVVVTVSGDGKESRERDGEVMVVRLPFIREGDWSGPHPAIATHEARAAFGTFSPVSVFAMQVAAALPRLHGEFGFDLIEAPETGALAWFALNARRTGTLWPNGSGPAIVTMLHSPTEWISCWNQAPLRGRRDLELVGMEHDSVRWSDGLLCPTRALAGWACKQWGLAPGAVDVIPHPLGDLEPVAQGAVAVGSRARREGPMRVVFAGRLERRKGVDTLLDGFGRAVAAGADLTLDLVGEDMPDPAGPGRFGARRLETLPEPARGRVRVHGRCPPAQVQELQAAADVIAIPAPMDNFPFTCVEAMARGRLIVAAGAGGMAEMIRDGQDGILFRPGDAAACCEALVRTARLEAATAASLEQSAAARILDLCSNAAIAERRARHAREIIDRRARSETPHSRRTYVLINGGAPEARRLADAANRADVDFGHGWVRGPNDSVRVYSTPDPLRLATAPGDLGPVALDAAAAADPEIAALLTPAGPDTAATPDTRGLVLALLARGLSGVVATDVISPAREQAPAASPPDPAAAELARIKASRGWRALQRVYATLHVLRGRGLRR